MRGGVSMTKHDLDKPEPSRAPAHLVATNASYEFHKMVFRSPKFDTELRKQSARWLIDNGVQFDEGKMIDPEVLPV